MNKRMLITLISACLPVVILAGDFPVIKDGTAARVYGLVEGNSIKIEHRDRSKEIEKISKAAEKRAAEEAARMEDEDGAGIMIIEEVSEGPKISSGPKPKILSKKQIGNSLRLIKTPNIEELPKTQKAKNNDEIIEIQGVVLEYKGANSLFVTDWNLYSKDSNESDKKPRGPKIFMERKELRKTIEVSVGKKSFVFHKDLEFKDKSKIGKDKIEKVNVLDCAALELFESKWDSKIYKTAKIKGVFYKFGNDWFFHLDKNFKMIKKD